MKQANSISKSAVVVDQAAGRRGLSRPPKRRTQAERSAATQGELLAAAITCLSRDGYVQTTVELVAKMAGVSRGAVQHHFGSRDQLLLAVVEDLGRQLSNAEVISQEIPVELQVEGAIEGDWRVLQSKQFIAVTQIWLSLRENEDLFRLVRQTVADLEHSLDERWKTLFSKLDAPPERVTAVRHVVLSTLRGLALRNILRGQRSQCKDEIDMLKEMSLRALSLR